MFTQINVSNCLMGMILITVPIGMKKHSRTLLKSTLKNIKVKNQQKQYVSSSQMHQRKVSMVGSGSVPMVWVAIIDIVYHRVLFLRKKTHQRKKIKTKNHLLKILLINNVKTLNLVVKKLQKRYSSSGRKTEQDVKSRMLKKPMIRI